MKRFLLIILGAATVLGSCVGCYTYQIRRATRDNAPQLPAENPQQPQ